ncbi:MAG: DUF3137 domain-containing protein [Saprospiraceae bacterium]|nr:DUF3137 domain-containing protein [Saprospiraceae bacterium]
MKKLEQIQAEIAPIRQNLENYRLDFLKKSNNGRNLLFVPAILAIGCFVGMYLAYNYVFVFLGLLILCALLFVWLYNNKFKAPISEYHSKFKSVLLQKIVHELKPDMEYRPAGYIDQSDFRKSLLFNNTPNEGYTGEDYFEGKISNLPIKFSEINAKHFLGKNAVNLFQGIFIIVDVDKPFYGKTFILPDLSDAWIGGIKQNIKKDLGKLGRGQLLYLEEHPEFEKYFAIYTTDHKEAKQILTEEMLDSIMELRALFDTDFYMSFQNEEGFVYIAVPMPSILRPNIRKSISENDTELNRMYQQLSTCFKIIKKLPLNFQST